MADGVATEQPSKALWLLALLAAGAGAGALGRYPHLTATNGLAFVLLFALGLGLLGLPLLLGEAALGQFRRRNAVDALGPGLWRYGGFFLAGGAVLTAALLAVVAGWAGRYLIDSFQGDFFDDPDRHFRLLAAGSDALLGTLLALGVATAAAMAGAKHGLRSAIAAVAVCALLILGGLTAWASLQSGATQGRNDFLTIDWAAIDAPLVVSGLLQALLPTLVGLGVVATHSARSHDKTLPMDATLLVILLALIPLAVGLFLMSLASANRVELSSDGGITGLFGAIVHLFAALPASEGGIISGLFYGSLLAVSLAAVVALLEVPATWLQENFDTVTPARAFLGAGLVVYLVAVPLCFDTGRVNGLHLFLAGVVAPLGGLVTSIHVGWMRPAVLDGFRVGDEQHKLDAFLRPYLRFIAPALLVVLLMAGTLVWLVDIDAVNHGTGGLWRLVP